MIPSGGPFPAMEENAGSGSLVFIRINVAGWPRIVLPSYAELKNAACRHKTFLKSGTYSRTVPKRD